MAGLLSLFQDPAQAGLLGVSTGLLQAGGPSRMPVSFGQALSGGLLQGQQMQQAAQKAQLETGLINAKTTAFTQENEQASRQQKALEDYASTLDPNKAVLFRANPAAFIKQQTENPFAKVNPSDYTQESVAKYISTRNQADLVPVRKKEVAPSGQVFDPYAAAPGTNLGDPSKLVTLGPDGKPMVNPLALKARKSVAASSKPETTVNVTTSENPFYKTLGTSQATAFSKERDEATKSAQSIETNLEARKLLDSGVVTGAGAEFITSAGRVLERMGIPIGQDAKQTLSNTQAYAAAMGRQVGSIIRLFGSGTGLSDADREYAEKIAGGKITLDEAAIRKLLDINDRIDRAKIRAFNKRAKSVESGKGYGLPYQMTIPVPPEYKPSDASGIPEGITEIEWQHMTPQERALWQK